MEQLTTDNASPNLVVCNHLYYNNVKFKEIHLCYKIVQLYLQAKLEMFMKYDKNTGIYKMAWIYYSHFIETPLWWQGAVV